MIPLLPHTCSSSEFLDAYSRMRAVLLRSSSTPTKKFDLERMRALRQVLLQDVQTSFTVENAPISAPSFAAAAGKRQRTSASTAPVPCAGEACGPQTAEDLLGGQSIPTGTWYASCVVQQDPAALAALCEPAGFQAALLGRWLPALKSLARLSC